MNESEHTFYLDLPASLRYLNVLSACIGALLERTEDVEEPAALAYAIQLAVQELCTNIVQHAYEERPDGRFSVKLVLCHEPRQMVIEMQDHGRSFDPARVASPDFDRPRERGYGLFLLHSLMDEVSYQPGDRTNHWRLIKRF